jgi:hypothetical protein
VLLWDEEMASQREALARLTPPQRLNVAVSALKWTIETLEQPIETDAVREFLRAGLDLAGQAVAAGQVRVVLPQRMVDEFPEVDALADEPGTSHFLEALMTCSEAESGLEGEQLFGVLSYCYEGCLDREGLHEWSPEIERGIQRCVDVIAEQKSLIEAVSV